MDDNDKIRDEEYALIKNIQRQAKNNYVESKDLVIPSSELFDLATVLDFLLNFYDSMEDTDYYEQHCVSAIKCIKRILDNEGL